MENLEELRAQLTAARLECSRLREDNERLKYALRIKLGNEDKDRYGVPREKQEITMQSPEEEKIALFKSLFRGRNDVYPVRWESKRGKSGYSPACAYEWDPIMCEKPRKKCADCNNRKLLPLTDQVIYNHLTGKCTIGTYPLLRDDTCWFLATDFDKNTWKDDVIAFLDTCNELHVPAALERSRSGQGGHVWIFFKETLPAELARKLGSALMTLTMKKRHGIGLNSYDRFFPNQDTLPKRGFGNLIALPLQGEPRTQSNTVFINRDFQAYEDQWAFLSLIRRIGRENVERIVRDATKTDSVIGVKNCSTDEYSMDDPWTLPPSKKRPERPIQGPLPPEIWIMRSNLTYIQKRDLPDSVQDQLIRLAAFQNPEFYKAQKMRHPVYGKPRIISCAEDFEKYIALPRGSFEEAKKFLEEIGIETIIQDERFSGEEIKVSFKGKLRRLQQKAAKEIINHDIGILSAATAFGKTVVASWIIAERSFNTLILVHRIQLADQWKKQLLMFLDVSPSSIGIIGGGNKNATGIIDIGMLQSLYYKGEVNDIVADYGQVIVDECHRVAAFSFEQVLKQVKARYILGLTATLIRKDGHHPIIMMQCGPARFRVRPKKAAMSRPFDHVVIPRYTDFTIRTNLETMSFHEVYALLIEDSKRNEVIIDDIIEACKNGRSPLLLTERVSHLMYLTNKLNERIKNVIVLKGGMGRKQRQELAERLEYIPDS